MIVQVDTDIPLPKSLLSIAYDVCMALVTAPVGSSVFVKDVTQSHLGATAVRILGKSNYCTKKVRENGVSGVRIWKVKENK